MIIVKCDLTFDLLTSWVLGWQAAEVGGALDRVKELEGHAADLRNTQADLSARLTHAQNSIEHMTHTLQQRESLGVTVA